MIYIGRAKNVKSRVYNHKITENRQLYYHAHNGEFSNEIRGSIGIVEHLVENPYINNIDVHTVQVCETVEETVKAERQWIMAVHHLGFGGLLLNKNHLGLFPYSLDHADILALNHSIGTVM